MGGREGRGGEEWGGEGRGGVCASESEGEMSEAK